MTTKQAIETADGLAAAGAFAAALRVLLPVRRVAPDHEHRCPRCHQEWTHMDEPCDDLAAPICCGLCERDYHREHNDALDIEPDPVEYF
jgi:hypothetical protein